MRFHITSCSVFFRLKVQHYIFQVASEKNVLKTGMEKLLMTPPPFFLNQHVYGIVNQISKHILNNYLYCLLLACNKQALDREEENKTNTGKRQQERHPCCGESLG